MQLQIEHPATTRINYIHKLAQEAFAKHELTVLHEQGMYRSWKCSNPDTSDRSFIVTTIPGHLFIVGDIGDLIVSRTRDMIEWSRTAIDSIGYFAAKVPHCIKTEEYDSKIVRFWCDDMLNDKGVSEQYKFQIRLFLDNIYLDEADEHEVYTKLTKYNVIYDNDYPDFKNWTFNLLWCREGLVWFLDELATFKCG